jgi:dipeptidyl aminopeptidase/acylaminoacyl peptidase
MSAMRASSRFRPHGFRLHIFVSSLALVFGLGACSSDAPAPGAAPAATAPAPAAPAVARPSQQYSIEDFVETVAVSGASFSSDESRILFSSNRTGIWNVYEMPVAGGEWKSITASTTDNNYAVAFFPADDRRLITRDQGGNELNHLYVIEADGSEKDLTPGDKLRAQFGGFSRDGAHFFVIHNGRDPRFFDLYRYSSSDYSTEMLFENTEGYEIGALSADQQHLALSKSITTNESSLFVRNLQSGELREVSNPQQRAQVSDQDFSRDSAWLYYTTNEGSEFMRLRRFSLADGSHEEVQAADWDIVASYFSHNGKYRATVVNVDGSTQVELYDAATGVAKKLPALPSGEIRGLQIARSEQRMAFYVNGDRQPNDLYVLDFNAAEPTRLTTSLNPKIDAADLVETEVVRFKSFDGMEVPNILWKPQQASADNRLPAIVWVHGGPGGQTTRAYNPVLQYLANNGYVVLGINNRGSSGYGKSFFAADDGKHGREPLWDCIEAKKYLQSLPYVDPDRIGIAGGSYGGYMTLAALAFHPDEFDVGVNIFGVSNWLRTLENIPPYWESAREALYQEIGNPNTQREFLIETSPLFHADKIKKPLMVLQGANDPRVIQAESDDIVEAVRKNGVPVEYVLFDDEGHGFSKKANQIRGYGAMLAFLDQHLKGKVVGN